MPCSLEMQAAENWTYFFCCPPGSGLIFCGCRGWPRNFYRKHISSIRPAGKKPLARPAATEPHCRASYRSRSGTVRSRVRVRIDAASQHTGKHDRCDGAECHEIQEHDRFVEQTRCRFSSPKPWLFWLWFTSSRVPHDPGGFANEDIESLVRSRIAIDYMVVAKESTNRALPVPYASWWGQP
jgi:hypothetical protein